MHRAKAACIPSHVLHADVSAPHARPSRPSRAESSSKMALGGDITEMLSDPIVQSAQMCCECGVCEVFAFPMGLQPRRINGLLKKELGKARIRCQIPEQEISGQSRARGAQGSLPPHRGKRRRCKVL